MLRQWKVAAGFVVVAGLIGLGVVPVRRRMAVHVDEPKRRKARRKASRRKGGRLRRLLGYTRYLPL